MTVIVQDERQQFVQQLWQMTQNLSADHRTCGIMISVCPYLQAKDLEHLQSALLQHDAELSLQCYLEDSMHMAVVVLEDRNLADTHYMSLVFKDFLERRRLLDGPIHVASFPESGDCTEHVIANWLDAVAETEGGEPDIRLFVDSPASTDISSILIADPEEVSRSFIKIRLELKGYKVYEADNGAEAFDKVAAYVPDLVITELNLPVMDGYRLIHKLHEEVNNANKIIVLTDKQKTNDIERAFELGVSDYVTKPFSISELEWRIRKL